MKELIEIVREYILGLKMELKRKELRDDVTRQQELAAYFTNCKLQRIHMRLVLSSAMALCFKQKNYATAAHFCFGCFLRTALKRLKQGRLDRC